MANSKVINKENNKTIKHPDKKSNLRKKNQDYIVGYSDKHKNTYSNLETFSDTSNNSSLTSVLMNNKLGQLEKIMTDVDTKIQRKLKQLGIDSETTNENLIINEEQIEENIVETNPENNVVINPSPINIFINKYKLYIICCLVGIILLIIIFAIFGICLIQKNKMEVVQIPALSTSVDKKFELNISE